MSYDFYMTIDVGGPKPHVLSGLEHNQTYNVGCMFGAALPCDGGINGLAGKTGEECLPVLEAGIQAMHDDPERYMAMNPSNGWGNSDGALETLKTLASWCRSAPKATLMIG